MGKRAGKKRTERKRLIYAIKQAKIRDEQAKTEREELPPPNLPPLLVSPPPARVLPRIREEYTVVGLPPLIKMVARIPPTVKKPPSPVDILNLFPEELDRDLNWSPDEFDREYFKLWEEENEKEFRRKRDRKRRKFIKLFGMDSDTEREMENDRKRDLEVDLFGEIISSDEEVAEREEGVEGMQVDEGSKEQTEEVKVKKSKELENRKKRDIVIKMEVDEERKEEMEEVKAKKSKELGKGKERDLVMKMEIEKEENVEMEVEDERSERRKEGHKTKKGAGVSRVIVPKKMKGHWLKSETRLDLSATLC